MSSAPFTTGTRSRSVAVATMAGARSPAGVGSGASSWTRDNVVNNRQRRDFGRELDLPSTARRLQSGAMGRARRLYGDEREDDCELERSDFGRAGRDRTARF